MLSSEKADKKLMTCAPWKEGKARYGRKSAKVGAEKSGEKKGDNRGNSVDFLSACAKKKRGKIVEEKNIDYESDLEEGTS